jgi:hypothetical protein
MPGPDFDLVINFSNGDPERFEALADEIAAHYERPGAGDYILTLTLHPPITVTHPRTGRRTVHGLPGTLPAKIAAEGRPQKRTPARARGR